MGKRGPKPLWQGKQEAVNAWFKPGTLSAIELVLKPGEARAVFIREAVEALIAKRKKHATKTTGTRKTSKTF
jgi:hypothetical protein